LKRAAGAGLLRVFPAPACDRFDHAALAERVAFFMSCAVLHPLWTGGKKNAALKAERRLKVVQEERD